MRRWFAVATLLSIVLCSSLPAVASDYTVDNKYVATQTITNDDIDGYFFTLKDDRDITWKVVQQSGPGLDIYLLEPAQYEKKKAGDAFLWNKNYFKINTTEYSATSSEKGDYVLTVFLTGSSNQTAVYDIKIEIRDLGIPIDFGSAGCIIVLVFIIALTIVIFYFMRAKQRAPASEREEEEPAPVSFGGPGMPGLGIQAREPEKKKKRPKKKKQKKKRARLKKKTTKKTPQKKEMPRGACPECGEPLTPGDALCSSCGALLE